MTDFDIEKPKLRSLDIQRIEYEGSNYLMLRDPLRIHEQPLFVPEQLIPLLALSDGTRNVAALRGALAMRYGVFLSTAQIQENLAALDNAYLLENNNFLQAHAQARAAYHSAPFRDAACAGNAYPEDRKILQEFLQAFLDSAPPPPVVDGPVRGLVSPHIDYERGGPVYAKTWGAAAESVKKAEIAIIFGTDHNSEGFPFSLTRQNYASPLGVLPTPADIVDALAEAIGPEAFTGELHHRHEHSVELAAVWMQYIRGGTPLPTIPILVGPLEDAARAKIEMVESVVRVLRGTIQGKQALVIAAGDLAHIGPAFDTEPVDDHRRQSLHREDEGLVQAIRIGDADSFFQQIQLQNNANNVCGTGPIYMTLRLLAPSTGIALGYDLCPADGAGTSVVSICGMALM